MEAMTNLKRKEKNKRKSTVKEPQEDETWFSKMSKEEQETLFCLSMNGIYIRENNTILMGSDAMDRYLNFKNEMMGKYK